ncbi:hypothetical protein psal_cds_426 [Pandoravirus salinus]|uniref:Uncharacterized protein n=1 Tax=Pandoravirus salinus TaxID=1349410 RepID=S4W1X2_9VIRU|nr:hypothetical protein psal_cds_426 [Pandoravirus salinus]AGO84155.1 hypothetical protein psal_cds_426 [Pandoravirus salinus]
MSLANAFSAAASTRRGAGTSARRSSRRREPAPLYPQVDDVDARDLDALAYVDELNDNGQEDDGSGSAGSDIEGSDDDNGDQGPRRRAARPRGPRASFLSLVSPAPSARRSAARRMEQRHPYVRRYAGTRLQSETPKYAFTYRSGMTDEPQYMSTGMIRGTIATMPLSELRLAVAYMLEHADPDGRRPTMLGRPANFERFEELREPSGGREILLHEIFKEDDDVLVDLYLIAGRVSHRGARARAVGQRASDMLGGAVSSSSALNAANDIPYERMRRPANFRPALTRPEYRVINPGSLVPVLANIAGAGDDPVVLTTQPARSVEGRLDGNPRVLQGVCDTYMDRWFARTANEAARSGLPELAPYSVLRGELAGIRRSMCPVDPAMVKRVVGHLANGEPADTVDPPDEETTDALLQNGFTREDIDRVWGGRGAGDAASA